MKDFLLPFPFLVRLSDPDQENESISHVVKKIQNRKQKMKIKRALSSKQNSTKSETFPLN